MEGRLNVARVAVAVVVAVVALGAGVIGWRLTRSDKASTSPTSSTVSSIPRTTAAEDPGACNRVGWLKPCPGVIFTGPAIVPGKVSVREGNSGETTMVLPVNLTEKVAKPVTVNWRTFFITSKKRLPPQANPSKDYKASIGTVTFAPGQTRQAVRVVVNGDTVKEPDEFLLVSFLSPKNARLGGIFGLGGGTIVNDDK